MLNVSTNDSLILVKYPTDYSEFSSDLFGNVRPDHTDFMTFLFIRHNIYDINPFTYKHQAPDYCGSFSSRHDKLSIIRKIKDSSFSV